MSENATPFERTIGADPRKKCGECKRTMEFILLKGKGKKKGGGRVHVCPICDNVPGQDARR